ncbi:MAG: 3-dehydroquinate synthase [Acidobacteria bacterium]|nr:3-dehydroquinate synthase [Acidobacteriota bacterium]
MPDVTIALGDRSYPAIIEAGLATRIPQALERIAPSQRYFVITDANVWSLYAEMFPPANGRYQLFIVAPGESSKTTDSLNSIWTFLLERGAERSHVVVAFGGGVVGDLAGFAASTVLRGIRLVQLPTTLLAQVDASIGGKTGVNHPLGKNLLGAFYQPVAVLIDPHFLRTLPQSEFQSGMYEIIKYALIEKNGLYEQLTGMNWSRETDLTAVIEACVRCKARVVAADEQESGRRMILNFGHTLGHAIEVAGEFQSCTHGQAVGWGMLFAACLSRAMGLCDEMTERAIETLVRRNGALPRLRHDAAALTVAMRRDKKVRDGLLTFVLPKNIGEVVIQAGIPHSRVQAQLEAFLS